MGAAYSEDRARALAEVVLRRTLRVTTGETVTIETWNETLPWATAFVLESRRIGAHPVLVYEDEPTYWKSVESFSPQALGSPGRQEWALLEKSNAYVFFWGPSDTVRESRLPESKREALWAWEDKWFETANRIGLRLARMYLGRVGPESARAAGIDLESWRRELVEASLVDPAFLHRLASRVAARLERGSELTIAHPNGTDLHLRLKHRPAHVFDGTLESAPPGSARTGRSSGLRETPVPSGFVVVAPDEEFGEGRFVGNVLCRDPSVRYSLGSWDVREGNLVSHRYRQGGSEFDRDFAAAGAGRDAPGVVHVGLNPKIKGAPAMEDQAQGNVTFALGSNQYYGGANGGHFHPFMILSGSTVRVDGKPLIRSGRFV